MQHDEVVAKYIIGVSKSNDGKDVIIFVKGQHSDRDLDACEEVYHLPVHLSFVDCYMEDIFDVGCA